jgi:hypothetical protein
MSGFAGHSRPAVSLADMMVVVTTMMVVRRGKCRGRKHQHQREQK